MTTSIRETEFDLSTLDGVAELEVCVWRRLGGRVRHFQVVVGDRGVILKGESVTYYCKQLAQHAVMELTGRRILANQIEVT